MEPLLEKLREGDLRSVGRVDEVVADIGSDQNKFDDIVEGLFLDDPALRLRTSDAVYKILRQFPDLIRTHKKKLLSSMHAFSMKDNSDMMVPLLYGYLELSDSEADIVYDNLNRWLKSTDHKFIKVNCLQAIAQQAIKHQKFKEEALFTIELQIRQGSAALKARGIILLKELSKA